MRKAIAILAALSATGILAQANLLTNPGFEDGGLQGWSTWNSGNIQQLFNWGWQHSGTGMVRMWWDAGVYQDFAVTPGSNYQISAWYCHPNWDFVRWGTTGVVGAITLEWRDASDNFIAQAWQFTWGLDNTPDTNWHQAVSPACQAPGNAASGRILLHVWNDGSGGGSAFYDDASAIGVIPEPSSSAALALGSLVLLALRHRRSSP